MVSLEAAAVLLVIAALLFFPALWWAMRGGDFRGGNNLKSLGLALRSYALDHEGYAPPLSARPGQLRFESDEIIPKYVSEPYLLMSHADPVVLEAGDANLSMPFCIEHCSYYYLGYEVWDDQTVQAFSAGYGKHLVEGLPFDSELPVDLALGKLVRLSDSVDRETAPHAETNPPNWDGPRPRDSEIPWLIERPHAYPGPFGLYLMGPVVPLSKSVLGGLVLYQDGHVEFIRYPGKWPMTEKTISTLEALATGK
ncbi:MAG: hypothetical protein HYV26_21545 [Candidatus Hydrogenedentes bacterium]|nr:hypothetical protein [Candidatus Hydrogenedentota bacterium]